MYKTDQGFNPAEKRTIDQVSAEKMSIERMSMDRVTLDKMSLDSEIRNNEIAMNGINILFEEEKYEAIRPKEYKIDPYNMTL